ncbi:MAG: hypothetical protein OXH64_13090 [Rhodospirillaceae bacterium]|nr:hypothetical protein [Rhodospirillaceae bacterium]
MNKIIDKLFATFGVLAAVLFFALGLAQLGLGWVGIEHHLGWWAAMGAAATVFFGFMLPMTIGTYFGVVDVLGWPWWAGVLVAAPGLFFMAPALVITIVQEAYSQVRYRR